MTKTEIIYVFLFIFSCIFIVGALISNYFFMIKLMIIQIKDLTDIKKMVKYEEGSNNQQPTKEKIEK